MLFLPPHAAFAKQTGPSFIRDAEIEHTLRAYARPLFAAAGLNGDDVRLYIINSDDLNAFVAGGQRLFMFRGLLERVETPSQLKGVIAHETGHIAGGHLARTQDALKNASIKSIVGMILGLAAAVAGGGDAGMAMMMGSQDAATKSFLQYSRTQESSADQAAITYLDRTQQSGRGMIEFLDIIGRGQYQPQNRISSYYRSHPVSSDRIAALRQRVDTSPYRDVRDSEAEVIALARMQGKLFGFTRPLQRVLREYPPSDRSIKARYARAIAYYRYPDMGKALAEIDSLIADYPEDPYFYELKGQALYETGDIAGALAPLETAVRLAPNEPLILTLYATVLNATEDMANVEKALDILNESRFLDPTVSQTWDQLGIAYSRLGDTGMLAYSSAERYLLDGDAAKAIFHAERALDFFKEGSPLYLRTQDIITLAKQQQAART